MLAQSLSDAPPIALSIIRVPSQCSFQIRCSYNKNTEREVRTLIETLQTEFNSLPKANYKTRKIIQINDIFSKAFMFEAYPAHFMQATQFLDLTRDSSVIQIVQNCLFDEYYTLESISSIDIGKKAGGGGILLIFKGPS